MATRKKSPRSDAPAAIAPELDADFNPQPVVRAPADLPDLSPDEAGYLVEGKYYAAVRFARGDGSAPHAFGITCLAYARDQVGRPYLNAMGLAIEGAFTASCAKKELLGNARKADSVRDTALDGALREMLAHIAENVAFESLKV